MEDRPLKRLSPENPIVPALADTETVADTCIAKLDVKICGALEKRIVRAYVEIKTWNAGKTGLVRL